MKLMKLIQQIEIILHEAQQPLHTREIARLVQERFPIQKDGDLERQVYSALDRDIRKDAKASKFTKVEMGTFCLKEYSVGHDVEPARPTESEQAKTVENESLKYPLLRFSSSNLEKLSPAARAMPLSNLGLSARPSNAFKEAGLPAIGAFSDAIRSGLGRMGNFGKEAHAETVKAVLALSDAVLDDGSIDWLAYAQKRGFTVLPEAEVPAMAELLPLLPEIFQKVIESQFEGPFWAIFQHRWLVPIQKRKTLEEMGTALGLTRSRVQQQEAHIFDALRSALLDDNYDQLRFRFRPELAAHFSRTKAYFS
ncbi:MAG: hypothetical protein D4R57_01695, partial [Verrucomicrobiales bacterium]